MKALNERNPRTLRLILIGAVALVLLCLIAALVFNILTGDPGEDVAEGEPPTPTTAPADEEESDLTTPADDDVTPTPTRVINEGETTPEPTPEPTEETEPTTEPTPSPTPQPTAVSQAGDSGSGSTTVTVVEEEVIDDVVENGGFEAGFDERGVALGWDTFKNDSINVLYSPETLAYVRNGSNAQRITTVQAKQGDRYTGLYQQIDVIPGETYTLEMHGQIRSGFGDVEASSYGYRMQYAVAQRAMRNWQMVPDEEWVELPWDEQPLNSPAVEFSEYTTDIVPTSEKITLFIRTWNKWADVGEAQFTLDDISLVGPTMVTRTVMMASSEGTGSEASTASTSEETEPSGSEEEMIDGGLPVTGLGDSGRLVDDGRFWGAMVVLLLLGLGAVYRAKWTP